MSAKLVAEEGLLKGSVLSFNGGDEWTIGRDPDNCQIVIEDPEASRVHAKCTRKTEGLLLENLSATNSVEVNNDPVTQPRILQHGDMVKIGGSLFRFYAEDAAQLFGMEAENEEHKPHQDEGAMTDTEQSHQEEAHAQSGPAEEVLQEEIEKREDQDDIIPPEEHANGEEKNAVIAPTPKPEAQKSMTEDEEMDSIFQDDSTAHKESQDMLAEVSFDLLETGRWLLKVVGGPNTGAEFSMQASSSYLIGTDPNTCDIVFHDTSVSRQHARITVSDEDTLILEDLKSRNGTFLDGKKVEGRNVLEPNSVVTVGTTSFVVYDREGEMQTIISPMLPSIVKVLQQEEPKDEKPGDGTPSGSSAIPAAVAKELEHKPMTRTTLLASVALIALVTGLFLVVGLGTLALFRSEPVSIEEPVNFNAVLHEATSPFPGVTYSYNKTTGRLLLVGHVLTATDKSQLIYNLQGLPFIKNIDDKGIVVDEYTTREINPILANKKSWAGVTVQTPKPGQFVLSGYLKTRDQADRLSEYISTNFPNLDNIERRIIIEEEVINSVNIMFQKVGIRDVQVKLDNGELTLAGGIPTGKEAEFNHIVEEAKAIPGVHNVRSFVSELPPEASLVNISDRYKVSGASNQGGVNLSVVINGRILTRGDTLDGMTITSIKPNVIFLEKEGVKYRIDY